MVKDSYTSLCKKISYAIHARCPVNLTDSNFESILAFNHFRNVETEWTVITGAPCSGKSTIVRRLEQLGFSTTNETARDVIDSALKAGFSMDNVFQCYQLIQDTIVAEEFERHLRRDRTKSFILDRGLPDPLAYYYIANLSSERVEPICRSFKYKQVLFLERLPLKNDEARPQSEEQVQSIQQALEQLYIHLGYDLIRIPFLSVEQRLEIILKVL